MSDRPVGSLHDYITLYLENGRTLQFHEVTDFREDDHGVAFDYVSKDTGARSRAKFAAGVLIGISFSAL